jgi:hypothetical protein
MSSGVLYFSQPAFPETEILAECDATPTQSLLGVATGLRDIGEKVA